MVQDPQFRQSGHPLLLVTKGIQNADKVFHVRIPGSNPPSPAQMSVVTPPRSRSPETLSRSPKQPRSKSIPSDFTVNFYLKTLNSTSQTVSDCVVKEKDVSLLMALKNIVVEEDELSEQDVGQPHVLAYNPNLYKVYTPSHRPALSPSHKKRSSALISSSTSPSSSSSPSSSAPNSPKNSSDGKTKTKKKRVSTRLFNEPEFEDLLATWEVHSLPLGAWSMGMHSLLKEKFPLLLKKYNYFDTDKKVHLCQYLFEKSNKRKAEMGIVRTVKRLKPQNQGKAGSPVP